MFKLLMVRKQQINVLHSATLFFSSFFHLKSQTMHMREKMQYLL